MKYSDLTPQERRLVFLFELARSLETAQAEGKKQVLSYEDQTATDDEGVQDDD